MTPTCSGTDAAIAAGADDNLECSRCGESVNAGTMRSYPEGNLCERCSEEVEGGQ